jgi:hypothetical protein
MNAAESHNRANWPECEVCGKEAAISVRDLLFCGACALQYQVVAEESCDQLAPVCGTFVVRDT